MSDDPVAVVRGWFAAINRDDLESMATLYAADAHLDGNDGDLRGRDAIVTRFAAHMARWEPALDGGARRRLRTIGRIETGIATEWVSREADRRTGEVVQSTGYDHFTVREGRIWRQREVVRPMETSDEAVIEPRPSSRRYPERPIVGVGAVVVQDDRVLLVKRRFEPLAGQWSLPGGTLEVGETLQAGVAREVLEETGLEVAVGPVVEVFDRILFDPDDRVRYHFVLIDYLCRPTGGTLQAGSDVADAVFATAAELPSFRMTPKAVTVAEKGLAMPWSPALAGGAPSSRE